MKNNLPFFDHCFDKKRLQKWISKLYYETKFTEDLTIVNFIEKLKQIGFEQATKAGVSIGIDDLQIPPTKFEILKQIEYKTQKSNRYLEMNRITALENFQNSISIWHRASEIIKKQVVEHFESTNTLNPVYMMAFSGARGNVSQVSQLVGMRGFMSDPEGNIIDYPIRSNFREGLTLTEYVISCYGARKGLVDTALRTADAGYLTRRLVDVAHSVVITCSDCQTKQGVWLSPIQEQNGTCLCSLEKRLTGRVLAEDIYLPINKKQKQTWSYFYRNQQIDQSKAKILASCFKRILVRSSLRCLKKKRVCQLCYGWTLPHAHLAPIGEAVGVLAAQSIGEPGTQLTMRTFHTGGVFSGSLSDEIQAPYSGIIQYHQTIQGAMCRMANGQLAFLTQEPGSFRILPQNKSQNIETILEMQFPVNSILFFKNQQIVQKGDCIIEFPNDEVEDTVLNTYTYYSKFSGKIKMAQSIKEPETQFITNPPPKIPKIEPFFEKAKSINPNFESFTIYAGQIYKSGLFFNMLPKTGDLINTKSIMNIHQIIHPSSGITKCKQNKIIVQKPILELNLGQFKFQKNIGYVIQHKQKSNMVLNITLPTFQKYKTKQNLKICFSTSERRNHYDSQICSSLTRSVVFETPISKTPMRKGKMITKKKIQTNKKKHKWPYISQTILFNLQKKSHLFGNKILDGIVFDNHLTLTEYQNPKLYSLQLDQQYLLEKSLMTKKYFVSKKVLQPFKGLTPILFQNSLFQPFFNNKVSFFQNSLFRQFKKAQHLQTRNFLELFGQMNKQKATFIRPLKLQKRLVRTELSIFERAKKCRSWNLMLKIPQNKDFESIASFLNCSNLFQNQYVIALEHSVPYSNPDLTYLMFSGKAGPLLQNQHLSKYKGEVLEWNQSPSGLNSLILTNKDTFTVRTNQKSRYCQIGDFVLHGKELAQNQLIPLNGKIVYMTKEYVKFQITERSLVASNSEFFVQSNQFLEKTKRIFTEPYSCLQMGDIVQGIPKIEEFFEARETKAGNPFFGNLHNRLKIRFAFYRKTLRYPIFIATRKSVYEIQQYIIDSIFKLYHSQGINISDKHLEIIVRQMTSKVKVTDFWVKGGPWIPLKHPVPTEFYSRGYIEKYQYKNLYGSFNVSYEPVVLGITKAALETDGFISAASFQETTRILSRAAIFRKKDYLKGLKQNVILGHIIPAGTAVRSNSRRGRFRAPKYMNVLLARQTLQVLTANYKWRNKMPQTVLDSMKPVRYSIIQMLCLEYLIKT